MAYFGRLLAKAGSTCLGTYLPTVPQRFNGRYCRKPKLAIDVGNDHDVGRFRKSAIGADQATADVRMRQGNDCLRPTYATQKEAAELRRCRSDLVGRDTVEEKPKNVAVKRRQGFDPESSFETVAAEKVQRVPQIKVRL